MYQGGVKLDTGTYKRYVHTATVRGSGRFPIDMLRHDRCFPLSERDAGIVESTFNPRERGTWAVEVTCYTSTLRDPWTYGRWRSFGCYVEPIKDWVRW